MRTFFHKPLLVQGKQVDFQEPERKQEFGSQVSGLKIRQNLHKICELFAVYVFIFAGIRKSGMCCAWTHVHLCYFPNS